MSRIFTHPVNHRQNSPTLALAGVTVRYGSTIALQDLSLQVDAGEQVAVVGPNGAGKSTLFQVIAGIVKPNQGTVHIYGSGPKRHICVGYVPQANRIDRRFPVNVRDVVMMGRTGKIGPFRRPKQSDWEQVDRALAQVDMLPFACRQIGELSGGQQQRVFLARALAQEAELLLLDEPLSGLDIPSQEAILQNLARLRGQGITMLVATHDLNQAAEQFERMLLLNRRLIAYGTPAEVLAPQHLRQAYGGQLHVIQTDDGAEMMLADTCCGGDHSFDASVAPLWHEPDSSPDSPTAEPVGAPSQVRESS